MTYKFVGIEAEIMGHARMDRFGQEVTLPDGMEATAAAALLLPAEQFDAIFDGVDVASYAMPASHDGATREFQTAKREAAIAIAEFRNHERG